MKLYVLDNGYNENDYALIVALPALATNETRNPPAIWYRVPVYTVLVDTPEGPVLFDTACRVDWKTCWEPSKHAITPHTCTDAQQLPAALKRIGFAPEDIRYVVASHLHSDHAGCLELFQNATVYVHEDEFAHAMQRYVRPGDMQAYARADVSAWLDAGLNWEFIARDTADFELVPGVTVLNLGPGHCCGMLGLHVHLEKTGHILLPSDAVDTAVNYGPPARLPGDIYDSVGYIRTIKKLQALQKRLDAQVWFGHDYEQFQTLTKSDDGCYD